MCFQVATKRTCPSVCMYICVWCSVWMCVFCMHVQRMYVCVTVLVDGEQETEQERICLEEYKESNNTSNLCLDVFSYFPG